MWEGSQPYLRASASRKAFLCKVKPNSVSGREVNQLEAPLSEAKSTALRVFSSSLSFRALASDSSVACGYLLVDILFDGRLYVPSLKRENGILRDDEVPKWLCGEE